MNKAYKIVFNDDSLIVVEKIAKILVQPSPKGEKHTLTSILEREENIKVFPCHRLDRQTTGLIIYAKNPKAQSEITKEFMRGEVKKKYIAFVKGKLDKNKGLFEDLIIDREGQAFGEKPKKAKTFFKVLQQDEQWSMLELEPLTGRTNQLRIQLAKIGHPILGERKYAFGRDFKVKFKRLALHAFYLSLIHPVTRERIDLKADLATDMKEFIAKSV